MKKNILLVIIVSVVIVVKAQMTPTFVDSIVMRDGKKLAVDIYVPDTNNQYPVILIQTPYNRVYYRLSLPLGIGLNLASSNYAFVIVDWRCFYGSAGACKDTVKRGEDGADVIEWITSQSWSNGKVGTWGPSALGKVQYQTAKEKPSGLICAVPLVAGSQEEYESYCPGGVVRKEYVEQLDNLGYGMSAFVYANPFYNIIWQFFEAANYYPSQIDIPMFLIGGWYDHNTDLMIEMFDGLRNSSDVSVRNKHRFLMGPWAHGGFGIAHVGSEMQGQLSFPEAEGWSDSLALVFLDYYLRDINNGWETTPIFRYMQMGDNTWEDVSQWPPSTTEDVSFYLSYNSLSISQPETPDYSSIMYDPRYPSPTIGGSTLRSDLEQGPYDQSDSVESRDDILIFTSPTLTNNVRLKGKAKVILNVSSDRRDTDFAIRLTDVYPDNRSILLADNILRMRFRNGFTASDTSSITPDSIYQIQIDFPNLAHTFLTGHKIRLDITSSNYPRFYINLNNGSPNMYSAGDTLVATNKVYYGSYDSRLILPVEGYVYDNINDENISNNKIQVYPNPSNGKFKIEFNNPSDVLKIEIFNILGVNVYNDEFKNKNSIFSSEINLIGLSKGMYFLKLNSGGQSYTKKILIE